MRASTDEPLSELTLRVYPAGESRFTLTEDAGDGLGLGRGEVARTQIRAMQNGGGVKVEVSVRAGSFEPAARQVVLEVYVTQTPGKVTRDGQTIEADSQDNAVRVGCQDDGKVHMLELSHK